MKSSKNSLKKINAMDNQPFSFTSEQGSIDLLAAVESG